MHLNILILSLCSLIEAYPIVELEDGLVGGTFYQLPDERQVFAFYGLPYAAPPVSKYRFEAPRKLSPWKGIWNGSIMPPICMQLFNNANLTGEEDCLYLNVVTPKLPVDNESLKLDVMVYFHGGIFTFGSSLRYMPDYIMRDYDVVFVSVNYRVGPLGFLSTGDEVVPGNNGLKDQVAALTWIKLNIGKFGGNPDNVIISGISSGATSVHYHYLSPLSTGLFHKGISISASLPWTLQQNNSERSFYLAAHLGCPNDTTALMIDCMKSRPAKSILLASIHFYKWMGSPFMVFGPVVEVPHEGAFLVEEPYVLLKKGKLKYLPLLVSIAKDEGLFMFSQLIFMKEVYLKELDEKWLSLAPDLLGYSYSVSSETERDKISLAIREYYFGNKSISNETFPELTQAIGDRRYANGITLTTKLQAASSSEHVFCLKFSYRGEHTLKEIGVPHCDVINYIMKHIMHGYFETPSDVEMSKLIPAILSAFMKTGDPRIKNVPWDPVSNDLQGYVNCLEIISPTGLQQVELRNDDSIRFWKNVLPMEFPEMLAKALSSRDEL